MSSGRRQDVPEPNRLFLAHVLVVVGVQHVCSPVPELIGSLQRVLVGFVVSGGESLSRPILDPFYPSHRGHSPAYPDQRHLRPWENTSLLHASVSLVPIQLRLLGLDEFGGGGLVCEVT